MVYELYIHIGSDHPEHKYLRHVRNLIASKWYDIGLELLNKHDVNDLRVIKMKYYDNANIMHQCLWGNVGAITAACNMEPASRSFEVS